MTLGYPKRGYVGNPTRGLPPWKEIPSFGAVGSVLDTIPQSFGTHCVYEWSFRGDAAQTSVDLLLALNGDFTTTNYHNQKIGGNNAAITVIEQQLLNCATISAAQSVAGFFAPVFIIIPWFRRTDRQKPVIVTFACEVAALSQQIAMVVHKRQGGAIIGTLNDAVFSTRWSCFTGNLTGLGRRIIVGP